MARLTWALAGMNVPALVFAGVFLHDHEVGIQTSGIALVRATIFALAYVSEAGRVLLEQIAREHNGEFKFISEDDIL